MPKKIDPVTLEILWQRLISIVDEADTAVSRTAFSSLVRDAHDYACMFTDQYGRELVQGSFATPGQSGAMALGVKNLINSYSREYYQPGDVFITNNPWQLAGHLNDICILSPMFYQERLVGFTACVFHHSDIGGRVASDNQEVFEEGLFLPFVKIYDAGICNESVMDIIRWNVRTPNEAIGDLRSQIAANHVCTEKICQMLEEYGMNDLSLIADEIIFRTEQSIRSAISNVPDGTYQSQGIIEQKKDNQDIHINTAIQIQGDSIKVDLEGSSPQVDWGGNVVYNFTFAYVFMAIKSIFDPHIPNNEGCTKPISMAAPEGSVVNCKYPAAVAARMQVGHFVTEIVYRALSPVLPENVIAGSGGTPATMNVFYGLRNDGSPWNAVIIRGGGMGASAKQDGNYVYIFPANGANTPVEIFESDTPLIVEKRELLSDSGGPGTMKGGLGRRVIISVPNNDSAPRPPVNLGMQAGRFKYPAEGLFGGYAGSRAHFLVNGTPGNPYGLTQLQPGDQVIMDAAGGGGYGPPDKRDPLAVRSDVINGYVTPEQAERDYKVIIDPNSLEIDYQATQKARTNT